MANFVLFCCDPLPNSLPVIPGMRNSVNLEFFIFSEGVGFTEFPNSVFQDGLEDHGTIVTNALFGMTRQI